MSSGAPTVVRSPSTADPLTPQERAVLLITTIGTLMVAVDSTIVILALPTMASELASPLQTIIWTILAYLLVTAVLTTQAGRLGDMLGRSRVYNTGFAVFTVGSALCGLAPTAEFLIVARVIQAIGGAFIFANGAALVAHVFPPQRRGRAFGFVTLGWGIGAILGILLGGVITTLIGWRFIFYINLPIGVGAVLLGIRALPNFPGEKAHFDIPGFVILSTALTLICYGAIEIASYGATITYWAYVILGLGLLVPFVFLEIQAGAPLIELRALKQRVLGFSLAASFLQAMGYLSIVFLLTMYLQGIRGLSPLNASVLLVPGYLVGAIAGPWFGRSVDRWGARTLATLGIGVMLVGLLAYSLMGTTTWLGYIPIISAVTGVGTGMFYPANTVATMSLATPRTYGAISGLRGTLMNLGALMSFVVTIAIASAGIPRYVAFEVFLGTTNLIGGVGAQFLSGIHAALYGSAVILIAAAILSWSRGEVQPAPSTVVAPRAAPAAPVDSGVDD
jgi:EmrB/QacA subfamily drug resistance transporter